MLPDKQDKLAGLDHKKLRKFGRVRQRGFCASPHTEREAQQMRFAWNLIFNSLLRYNTQWAHTWVSYLTWGARPSATSISDIHEELTLIRVSFAVFTCLEKKKKNPRLAKAYGPSLPAKTNGSSRVVGGCGALPLLGVSVSIWGVWGCPLLFT